MSLILALGTNLGDKLQQLKTAKNHLSKSFHFIAESQIYASSAVDYLDQPDFYNQVLEFQTPIHSPHEVMTKLLEIENQLGRVRDRDKGPRVIDIDLLFYDLTIVQTLHLTLPHPRLWNRGFVVKPLSELPYFKTLLDHFSFSDNFIDDASPLPHLS